MTTNGTAGAGTTRDFTGPHRWLFELSPNGWVTTAYPGGAKLTLEKHDLLAAAAWLAAPVAVAAESGAQDITEADPAEALATPEAEKAMAIGVAERAAYARGVAAGRDEAQQHIASLRRFLNARAGDDPDKPMLLPCRRAITVIKSLDEMRADDEAQQERLVERVVARVVAAPTPAAAPGLATPEAINIDRYEGWMNPRPGSLEADLIAEVRRLRKAACT